MKGLPCYYKSRLFSCSASYHSKLLASKFPFSMGFKSRELAAIPSNNYMRSLSITKMFALLLLIGKGRYHAEKQTVYNASSSSNGSQFFLIFTPSGPRIRPTIHLQLYVPRLWHLPRHTEKKKCDDVAHLRPNRSLKSSGPSKVARISSLNSTVFMSVFIYFLAYCSRDFLFLSDRVGYFFMSNILC